MRVGILEWASCGGSVGQAVLPLSIHQEGWAMCEALLSSLQAAGHHAVAAVSERCARTNVLSAVSGRVPELITLDSTLGVREQWRRVYSSCDFTLVIAPECNGILLELNDWCKKQSINTGHSGKSFVRRATDKLSTARALEAEHIPHPPTRSLSRARPSWLREVGDCMRSVVGTEPIWVIKPRDGVGCHGMQRSTALQLSARRRKTLRSGDKLSIKEASAWIVQPWIAGQAYSRAAIVDRHGTAHWLPVVRQHISCADTVFYGGGSVEPHLATAMPDLDQLLGRTIRALAGRPHGWIGVDFLWNAAATSQPLTVIEINPRLTTSFVGLCAAAAPDLAGAIVAAAFGEPFRLPAKWEPIEFTATGQLGAKLH